MLPRSLVEAYTSPMKDFIESAGWRLVVNGLMLLVLIILLALARTDNDDADAIVYLNLIGYAMLFVGIQLLKRVGAWPVR